MAGKEEQPSWEQDVYSEADFAAAAPLEPAGRSPLRTSKDDDDPKPVMEPGGRSPLRCDDDKDDLELENAAARVDPRLLAPQDDIAAAAALLVAAPRKHVPDTGIGHHHLQYQKADNSKSPPSPTPPEEEPQRQQLESNKNGEDLDAVFALDPSIMFWLSEEEVEWAKQVRDAVDGLGDVDVHISDFMCAHLAIASKGDLEWSITRVYKMQEVRKEYKILGTYAEGCAAIRGLFDVLPGCILDFRCNPSNGDCFVMLDGAQPLKEVWKSPQNIEATIRGCFYFCHAQFPSLECVRVGGTRIFEMEGYEWGKGMSDAKEFAKLTNESAAAFPNVLQHIQFYNAPTMANCVVAMAKKMMPKDVASKISLGHTFAGGWTLRDLYLCPSPEAAYERLSKSIFRSLKLRFELEDAFSLPKGPASAELFMV